MPLRVQYSNWRHRDASCLLVVFQFIYLAAVWPDLYDERVAKLDQGTFVEQGGAWAMQIDPATEYCATVIGPILR